MGGVFYIGIIKGPRCSFLVVMEQDMKLERAKDDSNTDVFLGITRSGGLFCF